MRAIILINYFKSYILTVCLISIFILLPRTVNSGQNEIFLREDFNHLEDWRPLYFKKIDKHTDYSIAQDNSINYLRAESNSSASGIIFKISFNVFEYPGARWRWRVSNVYEKGDARVKSGDDYPIRVYIIFKYDPDAATFGQRLKYGLAKKIYGEYPPHSTINYIWANRSHRDKILTNRYAEESKMVILQWGSERIGKWIEQDVNIIEDYRKAFGEDPPEIASLAIMNDSDNTGESAVSHIDYIEVYR